MDPIYVDDVVQALIRSYLAEPDEVVEIGRAQSVRVIDIARKIIDLTGSSSKIVHLPMRRGESLDLLDIRANGRMKYLIGYEPKVDLERGLRRTIKWYNEHLYEFSSYYRYSEGDLVE